MSTQTVCVSVGISRYRDSFWLEPLRDAQHDAQWFSTFARNRGVPQSHIRTLLNEGATRETILGSLRRFSREIGVRSPNILVYFAGHGQLAKEGKSIAVPLLLPHDASIEDPIGTSVSVRDVLLALRSVGAESVYIFIDACSQDITSFFSDQDLSLLLSDVVDSERGCFFVSLASHKGPTLEGGASAGGQFTVALLDAIEAVESDKNPTLADLAKELRIRLTNTGSPRIAAIGNLSAWLYPPSALNDVGSDEGPRQEFYVRASLNNQLLSKMRGRQRTPTFLYGPSCSGKTVALRQILEELPTAVYVSCDGSEISAAILLERIVIALHDDCPWIFLVGHIRSTRTESLARVAETGGAYVLIDHAERSNIDQVRAVADELASFSISTLVATNRIPSPFGVEEWIPVPGLGHDEIVPWLAASAVAPPYGHSEILRAAKGSPAEFWRLLHGRSNEVPLGAKPLDVVRLASILRLTNGYGDVELFHAAFDLDEDERTFIEGTPYILPQGLWHYPNDTLVEAAGTQIDEHLVRRAVEYLGQEIKDNRSIVEPAAQIVNIAVRYPEPLVELDVCLAGAISRLSSKGYSELISVAVKQMLGQMESFPVTLSCILEWAADRGRSTVFNTLLAKAAHHGSDPRFFVIRARIAWWMGDYASCIDLAQAVLEDQQVDDQTREAALLESGIGHFFLGSWNEAISAFSVLGSAQTASLRTRHWARFMKATANGLRGNDVVASIRQLGRSGEFLLDWGDFAGAAICFGNAAEIACKTGALDEAESFLSKGTRLAESHGVQINAVEHERVSLHVQLRRHGASNPSVEAAFQRLKSKLPLLDSRMEAMQVRNTLATASVLRGTLSEAASMIAENQALVLGNKEYEIYWRWNKTLLAARLGHLEGAKAEFSRGLALAVASENKLALAQFLDDVQLLDKASRTLLEFTKGSLVP